MLKEPVDRWRLHHTSTLGTRVERVISPGEITMEVFIKPKTAFANGSFESMVPMYPIMGVRERGPISTMVRCLRATLVNRYILNEVQVQ